MRKSVIIVVFSIIFLSCAFALHQATGQPTAIVGVQSVQNQDGTYSANITVSNVTDLYAWNIGLYYQSSVLNATQAVEGPFLKAGGAEPLFILANFTDRYNSTNGYILMSCARPYPFLGINGSGTLATVTFKAIGTGSTVMHIDTSGQFVTELDDSNGNPMPYTAIDGLVNVIPEFPSLAILPLFMIATLLSLVAFRRWKTTGAKPKQ
jgi:hypothetical protein